MTDHADTSEYVSSHNARSVVSAWRQDVEKGWRSAWGAAAQSTSPALLNYAAADAVDQVRSAADMAANDLMSVGFLAGHPIVRNLRGVASTHAAEVNRLRNWAADLALAETEVPSTNPTSTNEES